MLQATNLKPPRLNQQTPIYPQLLQVCRVTGAVGGGSSSSAGGGSSGPNLYTAYTEQFEPPVGLRDREACYVWEPNAVTLATGDYFICRLVGSYNGLPLYVTCCCVGSGGGGDITGPATITVTTPTTSSPVLVTAEVADSTGTPVAGFGGYDVKKVDTTPGGPQQVDKTTWVVTNAGTTTYQTTKTEAVTNFNGDLTYLTVTTSGTGTLATVLGNNVTGSVTVNPATSTTIGNSQTTTVTVNPTTSLVLKPDSGNPVTVGGGTSATPLRFLEPSGSGSNYIQFTAPAMAGDTSYTLPNAYPGANGYSLTSTTGGVLSWSNISGGTGFTIGSAISGGTAGRIIFEDGSNNIAQSANLTYSSNTFTVTGNASADIQHWDYSATTVSRISETGGIVTSHSGVADAELDDAEISQALDPTDGAPQAVWKGKTNDGTVFELGLGVFATSAPSTNAGTPTTRYGGDTNYCGDPVAWLVWRIGGTTYKIPAYT